jgi:Leucine-rich repeat (LRR) protein
MNEIEEYLNYLDDNIEKIDLSYKRLKELPDLSRFKNLKQLLCSFNNLTSLPENLPNSLEELWFNNNNLTSLPENLPNTLIKLDCPFNNLISLPENLPNSLEELNCSFNNLTNLPENLPNSLKLLCCSDNNLLLKDYPNIIRYENNLNYVKERQQEIIKERNVKRNNIFKDELMRLFEEKICNPLNIK